MATGNIADNVSKFRRIHSPPSKYIFLYNISNIVVGCRKTPR